MTTTVNATPDTLRAVATTLKMAAILDDRAPHADKARIAAWGERAEWHRLTEADLLDGLQAFYDQPHDRPIAIGDLIHHARNAKRTRLEREDDGARDERRLGLDAKAEDAGCAVASAFVSGPTENRTERLAAAELALQTCQGKQESMAAIREYFAAKREASQPE